MRPLNRIVKASAKAYQSEFLIDFSFSFFENSLSYIIACIEVNVFEWIV